MANDTMMLFPFVTALVSVMLRVVPAVLGLELAVPRFWTNPIAP
jgi:hypothetical protein